LYPHSSIRDILQDLTLAEYEVYPIDEHTDILELLQKYENPIVFVNIDQHLKEHEWEQFIRDLLANPKLSEVRL
jgi:hypothetical protein